MMNWQKKMEKKNSFVQETEPLLSTDALPFVMDSVMDNFSMENVHTIDASDTIILSALMLVLWLTNAKLDISKLLFCIQENVNPLCTLEILEEDP